MINGKTVRLIFRRELQDQLRDRRTIVVLIGLPFALYLVFGVGLVHLAGTFMIQPTVAAINGGAAARRPAFLEGNRIAARWMNGDELSGLSVQVVSPPDGASDTDHLGSSLAELQQLLLDAAADERSVDVRQRAEVQRVQRPELGSDLKQLAAETLARHRLTAIVIIPDAYLESASRDPEDGGGSLTPVVFYSSGQASSVRTGQRIVTALARWQQQAAADWIRERASGLLLPELLPQTVDVATRVQQSSSMWVIIFPALIVVMTVIGAMYPAIDLCAGERERGTLETLLVSPATRLEIVLGKFLMVMSFSCFSALLNLLSLGLVGQSALSMSLPGGSAGAVALRLPGFGVIWWVLVLMVLISAPFSALSLALASFARSTKEAQFYVAPLMGVALVLTAGCMIPGAALTPFHSLLPVVGPVLWLKSLLTDGISAWLLGNLLIVLAASAGWSMLSIMLAVEQFNDERILFPDADSFHPLRSVRRFLNEPPQLPTPAMAAVCFICIMLIQLLAAGPLAGSVNSATQDSFLTLIFAQQILALALPAFLLAWLLTAGIRRTLKCQTAALSTLGWALLLALGMHPLMFEFSAAIRTWFPAVPEEVREILDRLNPESRALGMHLLVFALVPGICEELAFRGFILSGFQSRMKPLLAVVFSSLLFGAMHILPHQAFNAFLLGIPLALLTIASNSILPAIIFHVSYNALEISRAGWMNDGAADLHSIVWTTHSGGTHYTIWILLPALLLVSTSAGRLFVKYRQSTAISDTRLI